MTGDPALSAMMEEVAAYPVPSSLPPAGPHEVLVPLRIRMGDTLLSFFSTTTVFGTPVDVTLSELAIEMFFPADEATKRALAG